MYFAKSLQNNGKTAFKKQIAERDYHRKMVDSHQLKINQGIIPQDVYQEFDNTTVEVMRLDNEGDVFLNDLMGMSKSVSLGRTVHRFRQASDAGNSQTSMAGQSGVKFDQVEYKFDGSIVPIHDTGYGRNFREWEAMRAEGFDALIDDQRESTLTLRRRLSDQFINGHKDSDGNIIVHDDLSWAGMDGDSRVAQITLVFDFTAGTGVDNKAAFLNEIRNVMRITNKCDKDLTIYVSEEIATNWENKFSDNYDSPIIQQEIGNLRGVASIKVTSKLTGNQMMGFPLDGNSVRPIVGMGISTIAVPRTLYNDNYNFIVAGAIGYEVREDFNGSTCAFFAK